MKNLTIICILYFFSFNSIAQDWESIPTPVSTNLILFSITFPSGQSDVGYTGGAHATYNGHGKILKTVDNGSTWAVIWESDVNATGVSAITFLDVNNGFAGTQGGDLMTTIDGGDNWITTDFDPNNDQGEIHDIEFFDADNGAILTAWGGVYITSNGGTDWQQATVSVPGASYELTYADASTLFAVGNQQNIYKSSDGGHNWSSNFTGPSPWMVSTGVYFLNSTHGMATSEEGNVFVTQDGGDSWSNYQIPNSGGLTRGALMIDENLLYATTTPGAVYKSEDGGVNWILDSDVDPNPSYYKIIMADNGTLFVSGSGSTGGTILRKSMPAVLTADAIIDAVDCAGDATGSIEVSSMGGAAPYTYIWSNSATTPNIENLEAGVYSCTVTDSNGEVVVLDNLMVNEPQPIVVTSQVTDETLEGANDGSISITVTGGNSGYSYLWCNGANSQDVVGLSAGECCVTVTDANSCTMEHCATIMAGPTSSKNISNLSSFDLSPNPLSDGDMLSIQAQFAEATDIKIEIHNYNGQLLNSFKHLNCTSINHQVDLSSYASGIYLIRLIDINEGTTNTKKILKRNSK